MKSGFLEEKNLHVAFEVSLFLKGAFAVAEPRLFSVPSGKTHGVRDMLTQAE